MFDPRKIRALEKSGLYTSNNNLIGITKNVFMSQDDADALVASGNFTTADVILSYVEAEQKLKKYNHNTASFDDLGGGGAGILAVDSELVLYSMDSDEVKHKEQVVFDIKKGRLLSWDSDRDLFYEVGNPILYVDSEGTLSTYDSDVVKVKAKLIFDEKSNRLLTWDSDDDDYVRVNEQHHFQDFMVANSDLPTPSFTVTDSYINDKTDSEDVYVFYEGMMLNVDESYTLSRNNNVWTVTLHGGTDYAGTTYEVGDWIRVGTVFSSHSYVYDGPITFNDLTDGWVSSDLALRQPAGTPATVWADQIDTSLRSVAQEGYIGRNVTAREIYNFLNDDATNNGAVGSFTSANVTTATLLLPYISQGEITHQGGNNTADIYVHHSNDNQFWMSDENGGYTKAVLVEFEWTALRTLEVWQVGAYFKGAGNNSTSGMSSGLNNSTLNDYYVTNLDFKPYGARSQKAETWVKVAGEGKTGISSLSTGNGFTGAAPTADQAWIYLAGAKT